MFLSPPYEFIIDEADRIISSFIVPSVGVDLLY